MSELTSIQFADGIADVTILGPIARIEFFTLRPTGRRNEAGGHPELQRVPSFMVAMPIEALAGSALILEDIRKKLLESGVLRQEGVAPGSSDNTVRHKSLSPNFDVTVR